MRKREIDHTHKHEIGPYSLETNIIWVRYLLQKTRKMHYKLCIRNWNKLILK